MWQSNVPRPCFSVGLSTCDRIFATTGGPNVRFGTKCPSLLPDTYNQYKNKHSPKPEVLHCFVHDIDMEPVGTLFYRPCAVSSELRKVRRKDGGRYDCFGCHVCDFLFTLFCDCI